MEKKYTAISSDRNYQIDVLKMICALLVVVCHCNLTAESSAMQEHPTLLQEKLWNFGWVSVHIFFIISGFLMIRSIDNNINKNVSAKPGQYAFIYVINKYKAIALPFIVSVLMSLSTYVIYNIYIYIYMAHNLLDLKLHIWERILLILQ